MKNKRLFLALELTDSLSKELFRQVAKQLRPVYRHARWVRREHYHITLYFLGAYQGDMARLIALAEKIARQHPPISLTVSRWGCFPARGKSQVLFAAISAGKGAVQALQANLVQQLSLPSRGKYIPHITVARQAGAIAAPRRPLACPLSGVATHFSLIDSELTRQGPCYTTMERFSLAGIARSE